MTVNDYGCDGDDGNDDDDDGLMQPLFMPEISDDGDEDALISPKID